ncbi:hypothetical protein FVR03_11680 [Pontibacter qinzhouensis]|uniref:DUF2892 domain-containing protein n=1 Tax=Pontibacter qinzhouensis TaxID=2603253 RepID=A0A5C8K6E9_9BACT|nr:hypothetical protein [Pontibacter qinzhouensis]TXK45845.1 hypothetical protein FVR03_11680 [Pontibacter qinzhouensis]
MIKILKYQHLTGWHLARWIRLVLGIALLVQAVATSDLLVGALSLVLLFQAITNSGCCGPSGCSVPQNKQDIKGTTGPTT